MEEKIAIAGSGAIATGLAATVAAHFGDVLLLARSTGSAEQAVQRTGGIASKLGAADVSIRVSTDPEDLEDSTFVVEAIVEEIDAKCRLLGTLHDVLPENAILATTTSSLNVSDLAAASDRPDRFVALHVFNPVPRMELVELAFPQQASEETRHRSFRICGALGKTAVEVPDVPGFVVNRLLFPYLFDAVGFLEETGLEPTAIDTCMKLGAGHPMGPLALLDFVGLDVSAAIADSIGVAVPERVRAMIAAGALGKKAGRGFYDYSNGTR